MNSLFNERLSRALSSHCVLTEHHGLVVSQLNPLNYMINSMRHSVIQYNGGTSYSEAGAAIEIDKVSLKNKEIFKRGRRVGTIGRVDFGNMS